MCPLVRGGKALEFARSSAGGKNFPDLGKPRSRRQPKSISVGSPFCVPYGKRCGQGAVRSGRSILERLMIEAWRWELRTLVRRYSSSPGCGPFRYLRCLPGPCCKVGVGMPKPNVETFLDLVQRSGLVEKDRLQAVVAQLEKESGGKLPADVDEVATAIRRRESCHAVAVRSLAGRQVSRASFSAAISCWANWAPAE